MAREFKLPDIGEGISEVELLRWYVQEGDVVQEDQNLAEIETDKAVADLPSPHAGKILRLHHKPGEHIPVGSVLVSFADGEERGATPVQAAGGSQETAPASRSQAPSPEETKSPEPTPRPGVERVLAAPAVRRRARELGIDLAAVRGTGPGGRITFEDVERPGGDGRRAPAAAEAPPAQAAEPEAAAPRAATGQAPVPDFTVWGPVERRPLTTTRRQIARKMVQSQFTAPHAAALDEADITDLEAFRKRAQERLKERHVHLTLLPFVMKATVAGLKQFPHLNASLDEAKQELILKRYYHIGIAIDTERGLIVPVIREVDRKSVIELAGELGELVQRTRAGKVALEELRGSTFTLTNAGAVGGSAFIPIINYPEVAILGVGRAQAKPVVREGRVMARTMLPLSIAFDHRVVDGADVVRFLMVVKRLLEDPMRLQLET